MNDDTEGVKDARAAAMRMLAAAPKSDQAPLPRYTVAYAGWRLAYSAKLTAAELEARLDPAQFLRIHRSAMVQAAHIRAVRPEGSSRYRVTLSDGTQVIVSRSRAPALKRWIL